jgi:hypothetical protein
MSLYHVILCNTCYQEYDDRWSYMHVQQKMRLTSTKTWLQAVKKLAITFHVACHVSKKYDSCQSYNTSAENMTTQSHMPRRIGIFSARAGQRRAQTPRPVKACPTCCRDRRFYLFIRSYYRIYSYDWCPKRLVGNYWTQSPRTSSPSSPLSVIFWDFMT